MRFVVLRSGVDFGTACVCARRWPLNRCGGSVNASARKTQMRSSVKQMCCPPLSSTPPGTTWQRETKAAASLSLSVPTRPGCVLRALLPLSPPPPALMCRFRVVLDVCIIFCCGTLVHTAMRCKLLAAGSVLFTCLPLVCNRSLHRVTSRYGRLRSVLHRHCCDNFARTH